VRGLIGETWRVLRSHVGAMLVVALVLLIPAELAVAYAEEDSQELWILGMLALGLVGYPWVNGALIATIARHGRSPLEPYGRTVDRLPVLVASSFVASLAVALGLVALIVPGLLLAARWSAAVPLIVFEGKGPIQALETSNGLVRGRTWRVVGAGLVIFLVAALVASPSAVVAEVTESAWIAGLANALFDVCLYVPLTSFTYAVYRQTQAI
jgi:hypothetical protein